MADIFLSYARRERDRAEPIKDALESLGLEVFFDVDGLDGGDVFPDVLDRELKSAGAVVSLWSPWSLSRPWIKIESRIGKDRGVLIPVGIADIDPLHDLPAAFYDDQRIDLTDFSGNTAHPGWIKLVKSLARTLRRPELLEREARTHIHSSAQADDLRREVEALRAQIGDIAIAKAEAASQNQGREQAFKLIDTSRRLEDYRRFLARYPDGAEAFEAERRIDQLESWAGVAHDDPAAIDRWFVQSRISIFPALADEARRVQKQARKAQGSGKDKRFALAGLGVLVFGGAIFAWLDPLGWRGDNTGGAKAEEQVVSAPVGAAETEAGVPSQVALLPDSAAATAPAAPSASSRKQGDVFSDCTVCPSMVVVPAGSFTMGSPSTETGRFDAEGPQRTVTIGSSFAVGRYEVTWTQYSACVSDGACPAAEDDGFGKGNRPVTNVDWEAARKYASWLSGKTGETYRLLSEAEWEYAARAGTSSAYWWGSSASHEYANYGADECCDELASGRDQWESTSPAGSFPANAFGLYDMHGNVWEWTEDCWNSTYNRAPADGAPWISGDCVARVLRGGSSYISPQNLRSAYRVQDSPSVLSIDIGFRVARTL